MIDVSGLSVQTKGFSIKDISLTVQTGSCHCLIGPTGCGKTTLLEAVLGLRKIKKGTITLDGRDITNLPVHERGFSYVPQDLAIFPHLTVEDNIFYGIKHSSVSNKGERYKAVLELVDSLGIKHLLNRKTVNLSGGERQRVALARALAPGHKYLLLDEPLSALHEGMKKELWFLLKELQKRYNFTILMVSHDMEETFFLADYVSVMIDGDIQQSDKKDMVYRYPSNLEVARFFGIKNIFNGDIKGMEDGYYRLYCNALNREISLPIDRLSNSSENDTVIFGIRSEDVIILRPDLPMKKGNLITGIIKEIHPTGANSMVIFKPDNTDESIEIIMPEYALSKLSARPLIPVTVSLRAERLFVLR